MAAPLIRPAATFSPRSAKGEGSVVGRLIFIAQFVALVLSVQSLAASPADAYKHYQSGKYDAAFKEYDRLRLQRPEDARLAFNAGAAAYQAKQFEDATRHFSGATGARDPKLAQSAFYNLGNAYFQLGEAASEAAQKQEAWESAIGFYDTALKLNSADADAKHNRDFVQRKLEELKKQQDKQQSKDNQDQKQDDKKNEEKKDQQMKDEQKQDKSGENRKNEDQKKSDDQKQQQKPDGSKQDDQKKQENQPKPDQPGDQKQPDQKKQDSQKGDQKQGQQGEKGDKDSAQAAALGQMTAQQAMQLLDAQRSEERALIFLPTNATQKANNRTLKNW